MSPKKELALPSLDIVSEEEVEKGFLSGSEAYFLLEQAAKAEPRRQIKTKGIPAGLNSCGWHRKE